jgi:hypothetical protein
MLPWLLVLDTVSLFQGYKLKKKDKLNGGGLFGLIIYFQHCKTTYRNRLVAIGSTLKSVSII